MNYKSLVACIYLNADKALLHPTDPTVLSDDPLELAISYFTQDADALIVFELSRTKKERECGIAIIKQIVDNVAIPVYGGAYMQDIEDIKRILYAGCKKAVLYFETPKLAENGADLLKEASLRFGKEKMAICVAKAELVKEYLELIEQSVSEMILWEERALPMLLEMAKLPVIALLSDISLEKILTILAKDGVSGIAGDVINENSKEIASLKEIGKERGIPVRLPEQSIDFSALKTNADGLIPVVVQDEKTGEVLMVAYMNEEAYVQTIKTKRMTYYSRSRRELWEKGATSGHVQYLRALYADCDSDTLLAKIKQVGVACHTGKRSCFFQSVLAQAELEEESKSIAEVLESVSALIKDRKEHPKEGSYTNLLFDKGLDKVLKKMGEEATEIIIAAKNPDKEEIKYEISDFLYHMMVMMVQTEVSWEEVARELSKR